MGDVWPEAITIIRNGFLVVCFIMGLLAVLTWSVGKIVQRFGGEEEKKE
jgi:Na+-transporting methylmalonyl-CoA/oxaloacetate decarboxylase gamma subunit